MIYCYCLLHIHISTVHKLTFKGESNLSLRSKYHRFIGSIIYLSIAHLVQWRTVVGIVMTNNLRSLVQICSQEYSSSQLIHGFKSFQKLLKSFYKFQGQVFQGQGQVLGYKFFKYQIIIGCIICSLISQLVERRTVVRIVMTDILRSLVQIWFEVILLFKVGYLFF